MGPRLRHGRREVNRLTPLRKIDQRTFEMNGYLVHEGDPVVRGGRSIKKEVAAEPSEWLKVSSPMHPSLKDSQQRRFWVETMAASSSFTMIYPSVPFFEFRGVELAQLIKDGVGGEYSKCLPFHIEGGSIKYFRGYSAADNGGEATQEINQCVSRSQFSANGVRIEIEGNLQTEGIRDLGDNGARYIVPYFSLLLLIPLEVALVETRFFPPLLERAFDAARPA